MSQRGASTGKCNLCGEVGELTKEHIPPQRAFNSWRVEIADLEASMQSCGGRPWHRYHQGGYSRLSLCGKCNNDTGTWYGNAFAEWARMAAHVLARGGGSASLAYPFLIYPLRVIKQVATMMFAIAYEGFAEVAPDLAHFILSKEARGIPDRYRFYACYHNSPDFRMVPLMVGLRTRSTGVVAFSEVTFPPFSFFLTVDATEPPHDCLSDITHFGDCSYHRQRELYLDFAVKPRHSLMPADFRTSDELSAGIDDERGLAARLMNSQIIDTGCINPPK